LIAVPAATEVHVMALSANPAPVVRSFSFADGEQRVVGGSAVVVARGIEPGCTLADDADDADDGWSDAQTAAFMAGEALTIGWMTQSREQRGTERVFVCCWITIEDDLTSC
jgi:hypothetical protein